MHPEARSPWFAAIICAALAVILAIALSLGIGAAIHPLEPEGSVGAAGLDGQDGAVGPAGRVGPVGPEGPAGAPGRDGVDGADGVPGAAGADGVPGAAGVDGLDGTDGLDGAPGAAGVDGLDGTDGLDGAPGADAVVTYAEADRVEGLYAADEIFNTGDFLYSSTAALSLTSSVDQARYILHFSAQAITHDVGLANARFRINCNLTGPAVMTTGGTNQFLVLSTRVPRSFTDGKAADSLATFSPISATRVIRVNGTTGNVGVSCVVAHVNSGIPDTDPSLVLDKPTLVLYRTN